MSEANGRTSGNPYVRLLIWPVVLLVLALVFKENIGGFLDRLQNVEVSRAKDGGITVKAAAAAANVAVASYKQRSANDASTGAASRGEQKVDTQSIAESASKGAASLAVSQARILWVDDNPDNNAYERDAFRALGIQIDTARSTKEALNSLGKTKYNLIISDYGRADDSKGGDTLLAEVKKLPGAPPVIIYSWTADPQFVGSIKDRGAFGQTANPQELFGMVVAALTSQR